MRIRSGALLLALLAVGCTGGSGNALLESMEFANRTTDEAVELIDDVVEDPGRAALAKQSAQKTRDSIRRYYENVILQRNELIHIMGEREVTREDCRPVFEKLARLRKQMREQTVDSWLAVRSHMTTDEWVAFNDRLQMNMDLD